MKLQRLLVVLTLANFTLLLFVLAQIRPAVAQGTAPVLRGHALEIVDDQGRVRASIKVHPADPGVRKPNGTSYPDTVMLRLIDPNGRPEVKLGASVEGGGLGLIGESDTTTVLLQADGAAASLRLKNKNGQEQVVKP